MFVCVLSIQCCLSSLDIWCLNSLDDVRRGVFSGTFSPSIILYINGAGLKGVGGIWLDTLKNICRMPNLIFLGVLSPLDSPVTYI